ncbi:MAG: NfeD family protein, partial [Phycisphaerae bacterium]
VIETARGPGGATKKLQTHVERRPGQHVSDSQSRTDWRYVKQHPLLGPVKQPVVAANELLTMSQNQAMAFGFARYQLGDQAELARHFGLGGRLVRLEYTWSEKLVEWLTSPMVRAVLLVVLLLAGYIELNTPGVGLPGIVALVCLAIFLGAPYMTGLADAWDILLVVAGVVLLGLEIFVIPGFGVAGIAGIAMICIGVVASFVGPEFPNQPPVHWPTLDYTVQGLKTGIWVLAGGLTTALAGGIVLSRILPKVPYVGQIVPPNPVAASLAMEDPYPPEIALPGDIGTSEGPLRPAGKARFNGVLVDVLTEGEFIEPGRQVKVIERRGNRIVVRPVRTQEHG